MKHKPKANAELLRFAFWIIANRLVWLGYDPSKIKSKIRWDIAEALVKEWRKAQ